MARTYFAALAAVALASLDMAATNAYDGSGASRYERVLAEDGSCSYSGVGEPDSAYYTPRDPSDLLTCTDDSDYLVLGCYEGFLDDCDALSDLVGDYAKGTIGHDVADYGWSCGHRLRWRDDWPGNSPARSCHDIDWSHG